MVDFLLNPGDLNSLFSEANLQLESHSPLHSLELLRYPATGPAPQEPGLQDAVAVLARPARVLQGRRGARRNQPWPFWLFLSSDDRAVLLAPEEGGYARLRSGYQQQELLDWLVAPFLRFDKPEIGWTELPALTPSGLAVLLAMVDLFRNRFPELDPDWTQTEPVVFDLGELLHCLEVHDPAFIWSGLAHLGLERPPAVSPAMAESLLYVFANEGYLDVDIRQPEPLFGFTEAFVGLPLSLAWWDLSMSLEVVVGEEKSPLRLIQALALWIFEDLPDGRLLMRAVSGQELRQQLQDTILCNPSVQPTGPITPPTSPTVAEPTTDGPAASPSEIPCPRCRKMVPPHFKFCGSCGAPMKRESCAQCGYELGPELNFCPECGTKR